MTTAMMITSSPEDLNNLKITRDIISTFKAMLSSTSENYLDHNGVKLTKEDIEHVEEYFSLMYNFLLNPGMTEEQFLTYEEETEQH